MGVGVGVGGRRGGGGYACFITLIYSHSGLNYGRRHVS